MEFRILGPLEVWDADRRLDIGGPKCRRVLAALACAPGQVMSVDNLVDAAWEDRPPGTARKQLQNTVSLLRQNIGGKRLQARSSGYVLAVPRDRVDACRFEDHLVQAEMATAAGDAALARQSLETALALWRGPALAGVGGRAAELAATRLTERRLSALTRWAEVLLEFGQPAVVVDELVAEVDRHPLREPLTTVLMLALCQAGRGAEALARYHQIRRALASELGVEPGRELRRLFERILADDPALTAVGTRAVPGRPVPAQLPAEVFGFTGRAAALATLDALLRTDGPPSAVVISAVSGTAGVGKTALAVHWAHRVRATFPDGQLYVNLRGFDASGTVVTPAEAVRRFLDALVVPPARVPADPEAQVDLYRTLLAGKRMLVVLDNARDPDQVRPLLPGSPGCLVLVTSRNRLAGLVAAVGARPVALDLLTVPEALDLLATRLGRDRVDSEPGAVDEIVTLCARLPIALAVVAANAATNPSLSLGTLASQLRTSRLDALSTSDSSDGDLRAVFSWSYRALSPAGARLFRLLGLHPGPDISAAAAASLAGLPAEDLSPLLHELTTAHLLVEHSPGRYTFHDLLRAYAGDLAEAVEPSLQRRAATGRLLDHYVHTAYPAALLLDPGRDPLSLAPPSAGVSPEPAGDPQWARDWFAVEHGVLLAAVDHAAAAGFDSHTWQLAWTLRNFLDRQGNWQRWVETQRMALAATERLGDLAIQPAAHRHLANAYTRLRQFDEAHAHLQVAVSLSAEAGDRLEEAHSQQNLSHVWDRQGRNEEALHHIRLAMDLYRMVGNHRGQARCLNGIGWYLTLRGDHEQAIATCRAALPLLQNLDDRPAEAATWDSIGYAHHQLGQHDEAVACYGHALALVREIGDRYYEAVALTHIGDAQVAAGASGLAGDAWERALAILDELRHPEADQVRAKLAGL
ncbi:AfsR/SARP family transcriptional regulator [Asanoa hainanensis]|uniref:AfsR/SARP family transcriptional regulator n=1 Tax=Asanoa hainanensis TaxID=560556 RepID=UPI000B7749C8|nr:BTAD domain-containing putative transcriptional regulator [Asanoa hainanensis]